MTIHIVGAYAEQDDRGYVLASDGIAEWPVYIAEKEGQTLAVKETKHLPLIDTKHFSSDTYIGLSSGVQVGRIEELFLSLPDDDVPGLFAAALAEGKESSVNLMKFLAATRHRVPIGPFSGGVFDDIGSGKEYKTNAAWKNFPYCRLVVAVRRKSTVDAYMLFHDSDAPPEKQELYDTAISLEVFAQPTADTVPVLWYVDSCSIDWEGDRELPIRTVHDKAPKPFHNVCNMLSNMLTDTPQNRGFYKQMGIEPPFGEVPFFPEYYVVGSRRFGRVIGSHREGKVVWDVEPLEHPRKQPTRYTTDEIEAVKNLFRGGKKIVFSTSPPSGSSTTPRPPS